MFNMQDHLDEHGNYTGPAEIEGKYQEGPGGRGLPKEVRSLKGLVKLDGDLSLMNTKVDCIDDLVEVTGYMNLNGGKVTQAPKLKKTEYLYLSCVDIPVLPELEEVIDLWGRFTPVPYMPKVKEVDIGWLPNEVLGFGATYGRYKYSELLAEVVGTPTEELMPLRTKKPILGHLIDAKLRGELV